MTVGPGDSVRFIPGVGEVVQTALERLAIYNLADLLSWYPRFYLDASKPVPVHSLQRGELQAVKLRIQSIGRRRSKARGAEMLEALCEDADGGELLIRWFGQPFLLKKLLPGSEWIFIGRPERFQGQWTLLSPLIEEFPSILSVYAQTKGVTSKMLRGYIAWVLRQAKEWPDPLPAAIISGEQLLGRWEAWQQIHQPKEMGEIEAARHRLAFEEVFWFFLQLQAGQLEGERATAVPIMTDLEYLKGLVRSLPFELTNSQKRAVWDMAQELAEPKVMTRLLNGDVGSGKTVVAGLLAALAARAGWQSVILVPTEVLARQHQQSFQRLLPDLRIGLYLRTQKDSLSELDIIVGTQALLQEDVELERLAFLVIDEQHRFGVRQRQRLRAMEGRLPHMLSMTATPIPRTLALTLYGNLSVSFLKEKPKDRLPVRTILVRPSGRSAMYERVQQEVAAGHQVFVICPLIEEKPKKESGAEEGPLALFGDQIDTGAQEKKTVLLEAERLRAEFPQFGQIATLHGKMKTAEKQVVMAQMVAGEIQVLVATSVIEVGVDIANATVMVIEGAERFGLAQLHQFRGRVGRDKQQAYCFLCPSAWGAEIEKRLQVLVEEESGFAVAEADLALRGPGELVGQVQSGLPDFRMASLTDLEFLSHVKAVFERYLVINPSFITDLPERTYSNVMGKLE